MATVDLAIFQPGDPAQQALVTTTESGRTISGEEKLCQRFIVQLLTEQGSVRYQPTEGSRFMTLLRGGACCTWEIQNTFAISLLDIENAMRAEESDSDPLEERYVGAVLSNIILSNGNLAADITLYNKAGTSIKVLLPLVFDSIQ